MDTLVNRKQRTDASAASLQKSAPVEEDSPTPPPLDPFNYNTRVAAAYFPTLLLVLTLSGPTLAMILVVGLLVMYLFDLLGSKEASFVALWATVYASQIAVAVSTISSLSHTLIAGLCIMVVVFFIGLGGVWGSLQYRFARSMSATRHLVRAGERALFVALPWTCVAIWSWTCLAFTSPTVTAYGHLLLCICAYVTFSLPAASSFSRDDMVLDHWEAALCTTALLMSPPLLHTFMHMRVTMRDPTLIADLLALMALPVVCVGVLAPKGAMWWVGRSRRSTHRLGMAMALAGTCVVAGCAEYRLVHPVLAPLLRIPSPYSHGCLLLGTYAGALTFALGVVGLLPAVPPPIAMVALGTGALACAGAMGMPVVMWPIPVVAMCLLVHSVAHASVRYFDAFICATCVCALWFVCHAMWGIEAALGPYSLQSVALGTIVYMAGTLALFGRLARVLLRASPTPHVMGYLMVGWTLCTAYIESVLRGTPSAPFGTYVYPNIVVVLSTIGGMCAIALVHQSAPMDAIARGCCVAVLLCKLVLLLPLPGALPSLLCLGASLIITNRISTKHSSTLHRMGAMCFGAFAALYAYWCVFHPLLSPWLLGGEHLHSWVGVCSALVLAVVARATSRPRVAMACSLLGVLYTFGCSLDAGPVLACFIAVCLFALSVWAPPASACGPWCVVAGAAAIGMGFAPSLGAHGMVGMGSYAVLFAAWGCVAHAMRLPPPADRRPLALASAGYVGLCPLVYAALAVTAPHSIAQRDRAMVAIRLGMLGAIAGHAVLIGALAKALRRDGPSAPSSTRAVRSPSPSGGMCASVGNGAVMIAMAATVTLNHTYMGASNAALVALASIMLLLQRDPHLLPALHSKRRYAPVLAAMMFPMACVCAIRLAAVHHTVYGDLLSIDTSVLGLLKDTAGLGVCVSLGALVVRHHWASGARGPAWWMMPPVALAMVFTSMPEIRWIAAIVAISTTGDSIAAALRRRRTTTRKGPL